MKMRRHDREITDLNKIISYLESAPYLNLCINNNGSFPYVVALNYGFEVVDNDIILYIHSAKQGRKVDLLKENNKVGIQITAKSDLKETEKAEDYSCYYQSVFLEGEAFLQTEYSDVKYGLDLLMKNVGFTGSLDYPKSSVMPTAVYKIVCKNYSAKASI